MTNWVSARTTYRSSSQINSRQSLIQNQPIVMRGRRLVAETTSWHTCQSMWQADSTADWLCVSQQWIITRFQVHLNTISS